MDFGNLYQYFTKNGIVIPRTSSVRSNTIKRNGFSVGSFSMNQSNNGEINIEVPEVNYPVTSVDKKANTFGVSISPTTGDVKIENTGLTGIHIQQSGQNRYAQITGGTDATHDDVAVKTKDITLTLPIPQSIEAVAVDEEDKIDAIAVELEDKGDVERMTAEEKVSLSLDKSKVNAHLYLKRSEDSESEDLGKIFAENDITIVAIQPEIPDIEVDTTAVTSGKAVGGLTVDATNKHKIIASAIDIPAEQVNAD